MFAINKYYSKNGVFAYGSIVAFLPVYSVLQNAAAVFMHTESLVYENSASVPTLHDTKATSVRM